MPSEYIGVALHDAIMGEPVLVQLQEAVHIDDEDEVVILEREERPISIAWFVVGFGFALGLLIGGWLF